MYSNTTKNSLKPKKDGTISNSSKTCEIRNYGGNGEGLYSSAYSYAQKILYVDHVKKFLVFNDHTFSNTTTNHQWAVKQKVRDMISFKGYKEFYVNTGTLNNFNGTLESLGKPTYDEHLKELFEAYDWPKKKLEKIKSETEKRKQEERESRNAAARAKNLKKKISILDFKTPEALEKAIKKARETKGFWGVDLNPSLPPETFNRFRDVILPNRDLIKLDDFCRHKIRFLESSPDIIEDLVKIYLDDKNYRSSAGLPYGFAEIKDIFNYFPVILKYPKIFEVQEESEEEREGGRREEFLILMRTYEALRNLASLGDSAQEEESA